MLGEEIIFNFDILIFLVISIGSWVFVLVGGMPMLRGKKVQKKIFISPPTPLTLCTAVLSLSAVAEMVRDPKSYRIISQSTASRWNQDLWDGHWMQTRLKRLVRTTGPLARVLLDWIRVRERICLSFP